MKIYEIIAGTFILSLSVIVCSMSIMIKKKDSSLIDIQANMKDARMKERIKSTPSAKMNRAFGYMFFVMIASIVFVNFMATHF